MITRAVDAPALLTADYGGVLPVPAQLTTAGDGNDIRWTFGNVVNPGDNVAGNNRFVIRLTTVVRNIIGNQRTNIVSNSGSLSFVNPNTSAVVNLTDAAVTFTIVEPVLSLAKRVAPTANVDAGDAVTFTISLSHAVSSAGTAWNVLLTDTLPANLINATLIDVVATGMAAPLADLTGSTLRIPATGTFDMPPAATLTVRVRAQVANSAQPGVAIVNRVGAIWSSMPGTVAGERTSGGVAPDGLNLLDGGALDDYEVGAQATLSPVNSAAVVKSLEATSAAHTSGANVTIGEVITYRLAITLNEGSIPSFALTDTVPAGLAYVGGSLRVDSAALGGTLPAPTVTPAGDGASGEALRVLFGPITVLGDNNPANNRFDLLLALRVLDVPGNVGIAPQTVLPNSATWRTGADAPRTTNTVSVTVVEPRLALSKVIVPATAAANDPVTVTLVLTNIGTSNAYSTTLSDPLPAGLLFDGNLTSSSGTAPTALSESGGVISAEWALLAPNGSSTLRFRARLAAGVSLAQIILNQATASGATTLPGLVSGERTEPAVNAADDVRVIAPDLVIAKSDGLTTTTGGSLLVYTLNVSNVGERAAAGVVISETVPADTRFVLASSSPGWS
ncbi:MAG: hypothetical protein ACRC1H_01255, partial [Caldilineaceae bacterium]